jgi:hypothetical protein
MSETSNKMERLVDQLEYMIRRSEETLAKFREEVAKDPAYALEWSGGAFAAAADLSVHKYLLGVIAHRATLGEKPP